MRSLGLTLFVALALFGFAVAQSRALLDAEEGGELPPPHAAG